MDTEYDSSRIERVKRGLFKPDGEAFSHERESELSASDIEVASDWGDTKIISARDVPHKKTGIRILKGLVVLAVLSAVSSGGYLLYQLFDPLNKPSEKNILITFDVPVASTPGEPVDLSVRISNHNRVPLEYANLKLVFPSGTRMSDDPDRDFSEEKKIFGSLLPGQTVEFNTTAIFLGEENTDKEIRAILEYRFNEVNSVFTKEETRNIHLIASPINLTVNALKEINAGQTIEIVVNAVSNTVVPLRDVLLQIEYPLGFTFVDAEPKPTLGDDTWRVGTLPSTGKFEVKIRGVLSGEDTQEKVFHTSIGVASDRNARAIDAVYSKVLSSITLMRPFIGITLALNGKPADQAIAHFGERVTGRINWKNNLTTKIVNAQIEVRLRGVGLDRTTVLAGNGGFYRSIDDTIFWDERGNKSLAVVEAGSTGEEGFSFLPLPPAGSLTNISICADITVRGKRISESGVPEEIKTVITQCAKVTSQAQFAARVVYFTGPFVNIGPLPPRVEQETTYTVFWNIVNTSNNLTNGEVRGTLPPYVAWSGSISPNKENVFFDRTTNQVIWRPGDILAGVGVGGPPREMAFQIIFTPSITQVKLMPILLNNIKFTATDAFTGEAIEITRPNLTTMLLTDPRAVDNDYVVTP